MIECYYECGAKASFIIQGIVSLTANPDLRVGVCRTHFARMIESLIEPGDDQMIAVERIKR